jgi:hypothetical protein
VVDDQLELAFIQKQPGTNFDPAYNDLDEGLDEYRELSNTLDDSAPTAELGQENT